ncbi:prepilin peptidase [Janthinobacterium lividum]|uniref:Prepilin peptidase n=1 Tax=Janthinobacterium lividum TaxID=29581 RepID=A0A5C4NUD5_9BURK|nr:A24 family peptidase [Janthinobacterium lividum]TNC75949.1 prepilin peptidase [Janthinobacterium lividum]
MPAAALCDLLLLSFVTGAAVSDLIQRKIPNWLVLAGMLAALALHLWLWPHRVPQLVLGGMATGFFLFLPLYVLRGMAAGDVKLIAMVGAFVGPWSVLQICFTTFVLGGVMAVLMITWQGKWRVCLGNLHQLMWPMIARMAGIPLAPSALGSGASVGNMPYGLAVALGCLVVQGRNYF